MVRYSRVASALLSSLFFGGATGCMQDAAHSGITEPAVSRAKGANNLNAKSCQKDGWTRLYASTWHAFSSEQTCTSHGAEGGAYLMMQLVNGVVAEDRFVVSVLIEGFPRGTAWWGEFGSTTVQMLFDVDGQHTFAVECPSRYSSVYLRATSPDGLSNIASNAVTIDCPP